MSYPENSPLYYQHSEFPNFIDKGENHSSAKRTPLQTISLNSPSLLARSCERKHLPPLYHKFLQVSQSTPLYKSTKCCINSNDSADTPKTSAITQTPVLNCSLPASGVEHERSVIDSTNPSEVSFSSLNGNIFITESSMPSLHNIDISYESFNVDSNDFVQASVAHSEDSQHDNKENEYHQEYLNEDSTHDDFLFHSRNSGSNIFLVPTIEDDLELESVDDLGNEFIHYISSCDPFGHDTEDVAPEGYTSPANDVNCENGMSQYFKECSLTEVEELTHHNGKFLDVDDPTGYDVFSDGYVAVELEAYEPEDGEANEDFQEIEAGYDDEEFELSSIESLSPGEIGSSLFSTDPSFSIYSSSSTSSVSMDVLKTTTEKCTESRSSDDVISSGNCYVATYFSSESDSDDNYEVHFTTAKLFASTSATKQPLYGGYEVEQEGFSDSRVVSEVDYKSPSFLEDVDPNVLHHRVCSTSQVSDDNWSLRVHTDSLLYQNELCSQNLKCDGINDLEIGDVMTEDCDVQHMQSGSHTDSSVCLQPNVKEFSDLDASDVVLDGSVNLQDVSDGEFDGSVKIQQNGSEEEANLDNSYKLLQGITEGDLKDLSGDDSIDTQNDWQVIKYDEEDCKSTIFHSKVTIDDDFSSTCVEDRSFFMVDTSVVNQLDGMKSIQCDSKVGCESRQNDKTPVQLSGSRWRCIIL